MSRDKRKFVRYHIVQPIGLLVRLDNYGKVFEICTFGKGGCAFRLTSDVGLKVEDQVELTIGLGSLLKQPIRLKGRVKSMYADETHQSSIGIEFSDKDKELTEIQSISTELHRLQTIGSHVR